jgi:hypothetical protein
LIGHVELAGNRARPQRWQELRESVVRALVAQIQDCQQRKIQPGGKQTCTTYALQSLHSVAPRSIRACLCPTCH